MFGIPQRLFERRLKPSVVKEFSVRSPFDDFSGDLGVDGNVDRFDLGESEDDEFLNSVVMSIEKRRERLRQLREQIRGDSKK